MKLNRLSLSLAITLALGSTFGIAHAETTATTKAPAATAKASTAKTAPAAKATTKPAVKTTATATKAKTEGTAKPATATTAADAKETPKTETKSTAKTAPKENLPAGVYPDTKDNWARDAIQAMTQAGYFSGYADNTFRPLQTITREQTAAIYGKVLQHNMNEQELANIITKENNISYSDVESDRWSNSAIKLVGAADVMKGTSSTTFTPAKAMDREEFVASAANLVRKINSNAPVKTEKVTFKDEANIGSAYKADIEYMAQRGFVASGATTDFNPKQAVTRAQAATILNRILNGSTAPTKPAAAKEESKVETAVKADEKKVDTAVKNDAKKADKAVKEDAKKVEKDVKPSKSDKAVEAKTEQPTRVVRPVRRSTLKALDQKQQENLENNVFTELNKTYKSPEAFQDYGVMYWRDNQLHVALKTPSDISTVKANLANRGNSTIDNYVVVEPSQYSQTEYDQIENNFRNYYTKNEKAGNIIATFPDVENNQLYAVVSTASKETQQGISKVFGSKVKMTVKR